MRTKRSRLALLGVSALAICVTVGLSVGAADAKKKGKKKGAKSVSVAKTTPTAIPPEVSPDLASATQVPLTVGKKAKGKEIAPDSIAVTFQLSGPPVTVPDDGNLGHLNIKLTAPNGRTIFLNYPDDHNASTLGPLTITANSPISECVPSTSPPPPPCSDPDQSLGPPYAGTIGDSFLGIFAGIRARGTWLFKVINDNPEAFTLGSVSLAIPLRNPPK
jgi:hypothetical protein